MMFSRVSRSGQVGALDGEVTVRRRGYGIRLLSAILTLHLLTMGLSGSAYASSDPIVQRYEQMADDISRNITNEELRRNSEKMANEQESLMLQMQIQQMQMQRQQREMEMRMQIMEMQSAK